MWQMRRWGGSRFRRGVVTRKKTGAHYLIESTGLDLDAASEWQTRVPIVKVAVTRTFLKECWRPSRAGGKNSGGQLQAGVLGTIQNRTPQISIADCVFRRVAV